MNVFSNIVCIFLTPRGANGAFLLVGCVAWSVAIASIDI